MPRAPAKPTPKKPRADVAARETPAAKRTPRSAKHEAEKAKPPRRGRVEGRARDRVEGRARGPQSPLAGSVASQDKPAHEGVSEHETDSAGRVMELHWGDEPPAHADVDGAVTRWVNRGDTLLRHLAEHGAARHEYRVDLRDGRFVWIDPEGRVSAEAEARVLCRWTPATSAVLMAWADPTIPRSSVPRIEGMAAELDDIDEEAAWRVAMDAADSAHAEYLYRVTTPEASYFLALSKLSFSPGRASFSPSTPVGLVLRGLGETRAAVESRAEPVDVLRERLKSLGGALLHEAEYAYRNTDWVARLTRTGKRLLTVADRLPRATFKSVAAGRTGEEWLGRDATIELSESLGLLEDEWALFV